jgi:Fe-S-cluster containining protein
LHHQNVQVFVDHDGAWHVEFVTPCKELRGHRCGIYETRPQICRDYAASPDEPCEQMHSPYKRLFRDVAEYDAWRSENLARAAARRRSAVARTRR